MTLAANPFVVLTYVSGPAILTNASALLLMSTSNRFARVVDRSRHLARETASPHAREQLVLVVRRVRLIARALGFLYFAAAAFALATVTALLGAVAGVFAGGGILEIAGAVAMVLGLAGFGGFVGGAGALVLESRYALKSVKQETDEALAALKRAN